VQVPQQESVPALVRGKLQKTEKAQQLNRPLKLSDLKNWYLRQMKPNEPRIVSKLIYKS
jgi:hypothetical protein